MKDQYVGDINDFAKYSILRELRGASRLRLVVAWMLTHADGTTEGSQTRYLAERARYRHLDPHVFDRLNELVTSGNRSVAAVEQAGVLDPAAFVARRIEDHLASRLAFLREVSTVATEPSLVFFDPDIGIAPPSVRPGRRRSAMYVFPEELVETHARGHSVVVYQHFARRQRAALLEEGLSVIARPTPDAGAFALWSSRVAFLVFPSAKHGAKLAAAAKAFAQRWHPHISFTLVT